MRLQLCGLAFAAGFATACAARAQEAPPEVPPDVPVPSLPVPIDFAGQVVLNPAGLCVEPPPMVRAQDYVGPFHRVVGIFTQKLDRVSVHDVRYKPGVALCSLQIRDKLFLFLRDSVDPETFLAAGFDAGISQARNLDPSFGQGGEGYGKRLAAAYADEVQYRFFKEFLYPTIFSEDPRYYRLGQGTGRHRFLHALEHTVVAYNDHGQPMFNFSEWLGEASAVSVANLYHPGARRGFAPAARNAASDIGLDIGYDELKEFWPQIARKLRLPFRDEAEYPPAAMPAGR